MKKFLSWFAGFFNETGDGASTTRALAWIWTLTLCGCIWVLVIGRVFYAFKIKDASLLGFPVLDSGLLMLTTAYLAAKVGQKVWGEKDSGSVTTTMTLPSGSFTTTMTSTPVYAPVTSSFVSGSVAS